MDILKCLEMDHLAKRQISELSGGQQQRLFIARALMQNADIFFLDEPFAGVDITTEKILIKLFKEMQSDGKALFIVHHDLNTAKEYFDWIILLNQRVVASGPTNDVFTLDNIAKTYGGSETILNQALTLAQEKSYGLK